MAKSGSLSIRVVEGRALPAKDVSGSSDPYCLVKVDDQVVARTATIWRSLSPFWGEEYTVHLPLDFHHLAFYVLDEDTVGHDDIIGKISLSKEAITADPRVFCGLVCEHHACSACRGQKRALDPLELELQMAVNMGVGNRTQSFWKSSWWELSLQSHYHGLLRQGTPGCGECMRSRSQPPHPC